MERVAQWVSIPVVPPRFGALPSWQAAPSEQGPAAWAAPLGPATDPDATQQLVLLVDDDALARMPLARGLEFGGYRVLEAGSGREALAMFQTEPAIAVVVTDTRMPGMSGTELIRRIRATHHDQAILRISGMTDADFPDDPPPTDIPFLPKPFPITELLRLVSELARDGRA